MNSNGKRTYEKPAIRALGDLRTLTSGTGGETHDLSTAHSD
jgi:hypothetical protein